MSAVCPVCLSNGLRGGDRPSYSPSRHRGGGAMATASATASTTFTGFDRAGIQFLADLAANNDRSWFQPRKTDYERLLREPMERLCLALDEQFRARDVPLRADPARSPFRIY